MMIQKENILKAVKQKASKIDGNAEVVLFGSQARNEAGVNSDWDFLILTQQEGNIKTEKLFRHALYEIELETGLCFSTLVFNKDDWEKKYRITPLYENIKKEGIKL